MIRVVKRNKVHFGILNYLPESDSHFLTIKIRYIVFPSYENQFVVASPTGLNNDFVLYNMFDPALIGGVEPYPISLPLSSHPQLSRSLPSLLMVTRVGVQRMTSLAG